MRRLFLIALIAGVLWFGLKDWGYRTALSQGTPSLPPEAEYAGSQVWVGFPEATPPGAWETPWGVDLFAVLPPSAAAHRHGLVSAAHDKTRKHFEDSLSGLAVPLAGVMPVYAPYYRHASAVHSGKQLAAYRVTTASDLSGAFNAYLETHSQGRGFILLVSPGMNGAVDGLLETISKDDQLRNRFGGVILLGKDEPGALEASCSDAMEGDCIISAEVRASGNMLSFLTPSLPRRPVRYTLKDGDELAVTLAARAQSLSVWLDANAPKPAEPLGGFDDMEVVEIAPIRNPGDVDQPDEAEED